MSLTFYSRFEHCVNCDVEIAATDLFGILCTPNGDIAYLLCDECGLRSVGEAATSLAQAITDRLERELPPSATAPSDTQTAVAGVAGDEWAGKSGSSL